jgi:photosystem II stability/assembly factor-like uncharacterized protein
MDCRIHVATRKGLFTFARTDWTRWRIEQLSFLGDPVSMVLHDPRDSAIYAGLTLGHFGVKFRRSLDGGKTWVDLTPPQYPAGETIAPSPMTPDAQRPPATLKEIWALEPGGPDQPGLLWAGTIPGGLFRSMDQGETWELVRGLWDRPERSQWFGGGKDEPGIHSICVDPRDSRHVTVGVSCGGVWDSRDLGATWECKATGMRAEYMPPDRAFDPNIQDVHRLVQCPSQPDAMWAQHHNGVFRTTDGGAQWHELTNCAPSNFGFAAAVHPQRPNTAWFVPAMKDERRVPVDGAFVVSRTDDGGESFSVQRNGLPQDSAYDIVYRHCLAVDETGDRLAMGSTTGSLWVTEDGGERWHCLSTHLPPIYCIRFAPT